LLLNPLAKWSIKEVLLNISEAVSQSKLNIEGSVIEKTENTTQHALGLKKAKVLFVKFVAAMSVHIKTIRKANSNLNWLFNIL
jgi:hypothetical protein